MGILKYTNWQLKPFKELQIEELYDLLKLRSKVFVVEQNCPYQDVDDKDKKGYHLYLKDEDEIIAYLRILDKNVSYKEISIGRVITAPKYRHQGIAKQMLEKAITFVEEELKESRIRISAQEHLVSLYESVGFKVVSEMYLEDDIPHIEMLYTGNK